ncbi:hypothetical protein [Pectobacterium versatile]|uniref:hypothetical protein n=1 Tax=Pectobacterium versatile TaxID=2488639 RepID=UPI001F2E162F|nr:hypothetical protein [Pectobacterium versatile]
MKDKIILFLKKNIPGSSKGYVYLFLFNISAIPLVILINTNSIITLFIPLVWLLITTFFILRTDDKLKINIIKSMNDLFLFIISAFVAAFGVIKTIPNFEFDIFSILMKNSAGYLSLCIYSVMFFIKSAITYIELKENRAIYKEAKAKKSKD